MKPNSSLPCLLVDAARDHADGVRCSAHAQGVSPGHERRGMPSGPGKRAHITHPSQRSWVAPRTMEQLTT
jgi:hypothetical protein